MKIFKGPDMIANFPSHLTSSNSDEVYLNEKNFHLYNKKGSFELT